MLQYADPVNTSIEEGMIQEDVGKIYIPTLAKPLFEVLDAGDNSYDLDANDYKRYMHIRVNNIKKLFNGDKMTRTDTYHEIQRCTEDGFQQNDYMKEYWKQQTRKQYCIDHLDDVYLQGNRDSVYNLKDSSYLIYEIHKCTNATRLPGYPECAPKEEMEKWLSTKYAAFKMINQKIDFTDRDEFAVRMNEIYVPAIPIKSGLFSDTGYRWRYNKFERYDKWWSQNMTTNLFYDFMFYNSDTFTVSEEETRLAEMYFRLEVDIISHSRVVFSSMDFIGSLGGVSGFVMDMAGWFYGGYAAFHSAFVTIFVLYRIRRGQDEQLFKGSNEDDQISPNIENIRLSLCMRIKLYFFTTCCAPCCFNCCKTKKHDVYLQILSEC